MEINTATTLQRAKKSTVEVSRRRGACLFQGSKIFRLLVGYDIDLRILMIIARNLICFVANLVIWGGGWCSKYCIVSLFVTSLCSFTLAFVVSICDIE